MIGKEPKKQKLRLGKREREKRNEISLLSSGRELGGFYVLEEDINVTGRVLKVSSSAIKIISFSLPHRAASGFPVSRQDKNKIKEMQIISLHFFLLSLYLAFRTSTFPVEPLTNPSLQRLRPNSPPPLPRQSAH